MKKTKRINNTRLGCVDIWNSFMVENALYSNNDIPFCPTTSSKIPTSLISYVNAKALYKKEIAAGNLSFHHPAYVHFYIDDYKFDGSNSGIWYNPNKLLDLVRHFGGVITPDFSTCSDFPDPLKRWNTYRMRAMGYWLHTSGINVINNVRWGAPETWAYCFDGLPTDSILSIGTVASGLKRLSNRPLFNDGITELVKRCSPHTLAIYGSSSYHIFDELKQFGINIITFPSDTANAFAKGGDRL